MEKRKYFIVRIGPKLYNLLQKQLESIKNVTYGVCKSSLFESGEILAGKYTNEI
jgi:hypothetical protein